MSNSVDTIAAKKQAMDEVAKLLTRHFTSEGGQKLRFTVGSTFRASRVKYSYRDGSKWSPDTVYADQVLAPIAAVASKDGKKLLYQFVDMTKDSEPKEKARKEFVAHVQMNGSFNPASAGADNSVAKLTQATQIQCRKHLDGFREEIDRLLGSTIEREIKARCNAMIAKQQEERDRELLVKQAECSIYATW